MNPPTFPVVLQRQLEDEIVAGKFSCNQVVTLEELSYRNKSSIAEIQQVIPSLERKGLIEIISDESIKIFGLQEADVESVFQFAEKSNLKPQSIVRSVEIKLAEGFIAKILRLSIGDPVFIQVRTRKIDNKVLANQYNFIPYEICPGLEEVDLSCTSFQATLENRFHTIITRFEETYSLKKPTRDDAEILNVSEEESILVVQRISYSRSDFPLVLADIHVNPAQFHYVMELWPKALPLIQSLSKEKK